MVCLTIALFCLVKNWNWLVVNYKQDVYIIGSIAIFLILSILQTETKHKVALTISTITQLAKPMLATLPFFIIPILIGGITYILLLFSKPMYNFSKATICLIILTIQAIVCVHSRSITSWLIMKYMPDMCGFKQLTIYITEPKNYNFIFSFIYVLFLSCSTFCNIEYGTDLISKRADVVILKSFLIFMAFNTMMQKSRETAINTKDLLEKVLRLFEHND